MCHSLFLFEVWYYIEHNSYTIRQRVKLELYLLENHFRMVPLCTGKGGGFSGTFSGIHKPYYKFNKYLWNFKGNLPIEFNNCFPGSFTELCTHYKIPIGL